MVLLRDMREDDVEDYVRWFTEETGWMATDSPGEQYSTTSEDERRSWTEYFVSVRDLPDDAIRYKFEIDLDGKHVGWVSMYYDLGYIANPLSVPAVGIDIPEPDARNKGVGSEALRKYLGYLRERGFSSAFLQTWSGNKAMLRVAEKLGFFTAYTVKDHFKTDGRSYDAVTLMANL